MQEVDDLDPGVVEAEGDDVAGPADAVFRRQAVAAVAERIEAEIVGDAGLGSNARSVRILDQIAIGRLHESAIAFGGRFAELQSAAVKNLLGLEIGYRRNVQPPQRARTRFITPSK